MAKQRYTYGTILPVWRDGRRVIVLDLTRMTQSQRLAFLADIKNYEQVPDEIEPKVNNLTSEIRLEFTIRRLGLNEEDYDRLVNALFQVFIEQLKGCAHFSHGRRKASVVGAR